MFSAHRRALQRAPIGPRAASPRVAEASSHFTVRPNPARTLIAVRYETEHAQSLEHGTGIQVLDATGRIVAALNTSETNSATTVHIPVEGLDPGIFFVRSGSEVRTFEVIR